MIKSKLHEAMFTIGIPYKLVKLMKIILENIQSRVALEGYRSSNFVVWSKRRQHDLISTVIFNIVLEQILREGGLKSSDNIPHQLHQYMAYTDDIALLTKFQKELVRLV